MADIDSEFDALIAKKTKEKKLAAAQPLPIDDESEFDELIAKKQGEKDFNSQYLTLPGGMRVRKTPGAIEAQKGVIRKQINRIKNETDRFGPEFALGSIGTETPKKRLAQSQGTYRKFNHQLRDLDVLNASGMGPIKNPRAPERAPEDVALGSLLRNEIIKKQIPEEIEDYKIRQWSPEAIAKRAKQTSEGQAPWETFANSALSTGTFGLSKHALALLDAYLTPEETIPKGWTRLSNRSLGGPGQLPIGTNLNESLIDRLTQEQALSEQEGENKNRKAALAGAFAGFVGPGSLSKKFFGGVAKSAESLIPKIFPKAAEAVAKQTATRAAASAAERAAVRAATSLPVKVVAQNLVNKVLPAAIGGGTGNALFSALNDTTAVSNDETVKEKVMKYLKDFGIGGVLGAAGPILSSAGEAVAPALKERGVKLIKKALDRPKKVIENEISKGKLLEEELYDRGVIGTLKGMGQGSAEEIAANENKLQNLLEQAQTVEGLIPQKRMVSPKEFIPEKKVAKLIFRATENPEAGTQLAPYEGAFVKTGQGSLMPFSEAKARANAAFSYAPEAEAYAQGRAVPTAKKIENLSRDFNTNKPTGFISEVDSTPKLHGDVAYPKNFRVTKSGATINEPTQLRGGSVVEELKPGVVKNFIKNQIISEELKKLKNEIMPGGKIMPGREDVAKKIDQYISKFKNQELTPKSANQMKRKYYADNERQYLKDAAAINKAEIEKSTASGLRKAIEEKVPAAAAVNKELSFYGRLKDAVDDLQTRGDKKKLLNLQNLTGVGAAGSTGALSYFMQDPLYALAGSGLLGVGKAATTALGRTTRAQLLKQIPEILDYLGSITQRAPLAPQVLKEYKSIYKKKESANSKE